MSWYYQNNLVESLPEDCVGFVYKITNLTNNRKYIGKKLGKFTRTKTKTVTLKNGTKKKKKVKGTTDSDWMKYYGSSVELCKDVELLGEDKFHREILCFCKSKGSLSYMEAKVQFQLEVLEKPEEYYNGHIQVRVHRSTLKF
jgi:hypothetical protein